MSNIKKSILMLSLFFLMLISVSCASNSSNTLQEQESIDPAQKSNSTTVLRKEYLTKSGKTFLILQDTSLGASVSKVQIILRGFSDLEYRINLGAIDPVQDVLQSDLDGNGYEELFIITQSAGSGSYGTLYGFVSIEDTMVSRIEFIPSSAKSDYNYMGHDAFSIEDNYLIHTFPLYKESDANANPSGGYAKMFYTLQQVNGTWQLQFEKQELLE